MPQRPVIHDVSIVLAVLVTAALVFGLLLVYQRERTAERVQCLKHVTNGYEARYCL